MKKSSEKTVKKLTLHRETVRTLEQGSLMAIRGAGSLWVSMCASYCNYECMPN
jgi:hypothetical protein